MIVSKSKGCFCFGLFVLGKEEVNNYNYSLYFTIHSKNACMIIMLKVSVV